MARAPRPPLAFAAVPPRLSAGRRLAPLLATVTLAGCLVQPRTVAPDDSDRVLAPTPPAGLDDPAALGPYRVGALTYGSGTDRRRAAYRDSVAYRTAPVDASPFAKMEPGVARSRRKTWGFDATRFPRNARVWYPDTAGRFPLVLVVHGNHDPLDYSDPGYEWIGRRFASRGFVVASIDENFLNGGLRGENDARGWMLLKHLESIRALADTAGKPLHQKVDLDRIVLVGHSRGGEAVGIAAAFNRLPFYPDDATIRFDFGFAIRGVLAIAPVDGQYLPADAPTPVRGVSYLVIHGAHDGDVTSMSGMRLYNRLDPAPWPGDTSGCCFKAAIWVHRANHGQWNTVWGNRDNGQLSPRRLRLDALMTGEEQRQFGATVLGAFLEATVRGRPAYRALFRDLRIAGPWLPRTLYQARYADATFRPLATFDGDVDVTTGSSGVVLRTDSLSTWKEGEVTSRDAGRGSSFGTRAATFGWHNGTDSLPRTPAAVTFAIPDSLRRAASVGRQSAVALSLTWLRDTPAPRRAARRDSAATDSTSRPTRPRRPAARPAPDSTPPDLTVELVDAAGTVARLPLSTFGPVRRPIDVYVLRRRGRDKARFGTLAETILPTFVMPLARFAAIEPRFDPATLATVRLRFDRTRVGAVLVDDVGLLDLR
jgi:dienelactone hydrolase